MSQVILISDNTFFGPTGITRYMGPYALANGLEIDGISTSIIDYATKAQDFWLVLESQLSEETKIVGISSTFMSSPIQIGINNSDTFSYDSAANYLTSPLLNDDPKVFDNWLKKIRSLMNQRCPSAKIFIGGAKVQSLFNYPEYMFSEIDYITWGQTDNIFSEIYRDLIHTGDVRHFTHAGRKIVDTRSHYQQKNYCLPMAWRPRWRIQPGEALPIEISRGCRFNCKFCHYDKQDSFVKNLADLKQEFINNYEIMGTQYYHFCDDCFNDHPDKVRAICNLILSLPFKIEWVSYVRVDTAVKFPDTVELMVKSGARGLFWGIESFNEVAARRAGKGTPPNKVKDFLLKFYNDYGDVCTSLGSFIVGLPGETPASQYETIQWVTQEPAFHFVNIGPLRLTPYKAIFDKNLLDYADYSRNPQKYGFKYIDFATDDKNQFSENWAHDTMSSLQAAELSAEFLKRWKASNTKRRGLVPSMWSYPHLRSLGYSHSEVFQIHFTEDRAAYYLKDASQKFAKRLNLYFNSLQKGRPHDFASTELI